MTVKGRVWKFGDHVDTDQIIPAKYSVLLEASDLGVHAMEGVHDRERLFAEEVSSGDILLAGRNFGCGSSREIAPLALRGCGISAVIAQSFARTFYRNSINIGLPIIECAEAVNRSSEHDVVEFDIEDGAITNLTTGERFEFEQPAPLIMDILRLGGLSAWVRQRLATATVEAR